MNKILLLFTFYFPICSLSADSFNYLYNDLVNLWTLGRNSEFIPYDFDEPYLHNKVGNIIFTGNELDFFVARGFFVVFDDINDTTYLTRNGSFHFDLRGILVNGDGYYVMNFENQFIYESEFQYKKKSFIHHFLIVVPNDRNYTVTSKYIISPNFRRVKSEGSNNFLETMPVNLFMLIDHAMLHIDENMDFENKNGIIYLMYKRYYQLVDLNNTFTVNSPNYILPEHLEELLNKIKIIESKLLDWDSLTNE